MKKEIVIIGGGFAGINLVRHLADGPGFHITLVDRNNYNAFPPLLYIRQWQRLVPTLALLSPQGITARLIST